MQCQTIELLPAGPGTRHQLQVLRFGTPGHSPKAVIQAALHADEVPGMLVAHKLRERLLQIEADGGVLGELVLLPCANPLGLTQQLLGMHQGRFDLRDGINFNRGHAELGAAVAASVGSRLGADEAANTRLVRESLRAMAARLTATQPAQDLKHKLLQLAIDADIVLDLHCDAQAVMHLYALTPQAGIATELGTLLGAQAVLLATESGDSPFDEACSRPWFVLRERCPQAAVALACFSATVELRGAADTGHAMAAQDADALIEFLRRRGVLAGTPAPLPPPRCEATPLAGSETVMAPHAGVVVFHCEPGSRVAAGDVVADLVDPVSGGVLALRAQSAGVLYARSASRWAFPGERLAKIAGTTLARTGKLLGP